MKYLKLYENFNSNIEDTLEDIKWIMVEMAESHNLLGNEKDDCMLYEISNIPSEEDLESAKGRLEDLGYSIVYIGKPRIGATTRDLKDNTLCWIVKSEICKEHCKDLPNTLAYFEDNKIIEDIQKRILLKMWKEDPNIDSERLKILCIFNNEYSADQILGSLILKKRK